MIGTFGRDDLVYGLTDNLDSFRAAGGGGGRKLIEIRPDSKDWKADTVLELDKALAEGRAIRFDVSGIDDLAGVIGGYGPHADSVTATELRHIYDNWVSFQDIVTFYENGKVVVPSW